MWAKHHELVLFQQSRNFPLCTRKWDQRGHLGLEHVLTQILFLNQLYFHDISKLWNHHFNPQIFPGFPHLYPWVLGQTFYLLHILCLLQVCFQQRIKQIFLVIIQTVNPQVISLVILSFSPLFNQLWRPDIFRHHYLYLIQVIFWSCLWVSLISFVKISKIKLRY